MIHNIYSAVKKVLRAHLILLKKMSVSNLLQRIKLILIKGLKNFEASVVLVRRGG